jgi:hypothetical protein
LDGKIISMIFPPGIIVFKGSGKKIIDVFKPSP